MCPCHTSPHPKLPISWHLDLTLAHRAALPRHADGVAATSLVAGFLGAGDKSIQAGAEAAGVLGVGEFLATQVVLREVLATWGWWDSSNNAEELPCFHQHWAVYSTLECHPWFLLQN